MITQPELLVKVGLSLWTGGDGPDLKIEVLEALGVEYVVREKRVEKRGGTSVVRTVKVKQPEPEPEPEPELVEKQKRGWGRTEKRTEKLDLRLSADERADIEAAADIAGLSRADYLRRVLWGAVQSDRAFRGEPVDPKWLDEIDQRIKSSPLAKRESV